VEGLPLVGSSEFRSSSSPPSPPVQRLVSAVREKEGEDWAERFSVVTDTGTGSSWGGSGGEREKEWSERSEEGTSPSRWWEKANDAASNGEEGADRNAELDIRDRDDASSSSSASAASSASSGLASCGTARRTGNAETKRESPGGGGVGNAALPAEV
jgi:hypothetical protein